MNQLTNDQLSAAMAQLQQMCHDASHADGLRKSARLEKLLAESAGDADGNHS